MDLELERSAKREGSPKGLRLSICCERRERKSAKRKGDNQRREAGIQGSMWEGGTASIV